MTFASKKPNAAIQTKPLLVNGRMLALEPRHVFDAAMATELIDAAHAHSVTLDAHIVDKTADHGAHIVDAANELAAIMPADAADRDFAVETYVAAHNLTQSNREIVFIDTRLADIGTLVSSVTDGTRIVLIDGAKDGVAQMVDALKGEQGISGIHILSHGTVGNLELGASSINADTMSTIYRSALASIGANLSADADILVYGCDFGAGEEGARAAEMLASLTGADVANSTDLTGAADKGGDWVLESATGVIDAQTLASANYAALLVAGDADDDSVLDTADVDDDNDGILDVNEQTYVFTPGNFVVSGNAKSNATVPTLAPNEFVLTTASPTSQKGAINSNVLLDFNSDFTFAVSASVGSNDAGGDGVALFFHNDPAGSGALGSTGGGFGARGL